MQTRADLPTARELYERSLAIQEQQGERDQAEYARTLVNLGSVLRVLGDSQAARERLDRALAIQEQIYGSQPVGPDHVEFARALAELGIVLRAEGNLELARERLEWARDIHQRVYDQRYGRTTEVQIEFERTLVISG